MITILSITARIDNVIDRPQWKTGTAGATPRRSVCLMADLKDQLRADLTTAMKSQDKLRTATLRMLLAAIQT